jgi:seryl-tRNA synthetase
MHDIKAIRDDPDAFDAGLASRNLQHEAAGIIEIDDRLRAAQSTLQLVQAKRNELSRQVGQAMARNDVVGASVLRAEVESLKDTMHSLDVRADLLKSELTLVLSRLPNIPAADVPLGPGEECNVEQRRWGEPFALETPKDHVDLGTALGLMDFQAAAKMSGARFVVLRDDLARLERALGQFMLDYQTQENGYTEVSPPLLVRDEAVFGVGQLPKFEEDLFSILKPRDVFDRSIEALVRAMESPEARNTRADPETLPDGSISWALDKEAVLRLADLKFEDVPLSDRLWLISTAEVALTNLVREAITDEAELPMRLTALTPCFRSEAGASGKDTRGMIRQHQFYKVELVSVTTPEQSNDEHERMVSCAEGVLKRLQLPFRTMLLCTGDMGFASRKTYDLEVWLPSQGTYREISSCSNCGDFQARRMDARIKKAGERGTRFAHTLNGSGLAVGRTLVAIMENYQDEQGRIAIPQALHPYMRGLTHIEAAA